MPGLSVSPSSCQSHSYSCCLQHWTLLSVSLLNCLLSTACSVGLALAVALTVHSRGTHLVKGCNSSALPMDARSAIATNDCPFNTTRIYVSLQGHCTPSVLPSASFSLCVLSSFPSHSPSCFHSLSLSFLSPAAHTVSAECVQTAWCNAHVPLTPCSTGHSPGPLVPLLAAGSCRSRAVRQVLFGGSSLPGHRALCTQLWQRAGMPC